MSRASMKVLSREEVDLVHESSMRILSEVGVKIDSPSVLDLLKKAGVKVDSKKQTVHLDEQIVSEALRTAPRKIKICSRRGKDFEIPSRGVQLMSPDGQPPAMFDPDTCRKRPSTMEDMRKWSVLADAMPEVDFFWPPVIANDVPTKMKEKSSYYEFLIAAAYTDKHIQHGATSAEEAHFQIELMSSIAGSAEALKKRPLFSDVCTPISPLRYDKGEAEALIILSKAGIPMVHLSMGIAGSVTPVTVAGTLAVINAENLCGLTLTQIASPGAPSIYSSFSGVTDLKSGVFLCGSPEGTLMDSAGIEMAKHYGLPSCCGGPSNTSKALSAEAGYQSAITTMGSVLGGADMMVGLGGLDRAGMMCFEKLVMDCEILRWLKRVKSGVTVNAATIGLDAIRRQGPGGTFLSDPHTRKFMRKDLLVPQITGYHTPGEPVYGRDDLVEYAKKKTKEILAKHRSPLLSKEISEKVAKVATKYGVLLDNGKQIFEHA